MTVLHTARKIFWPFGLDIQRFDPLYNHTARRKHLIEKYRIDTVLDVGANTGQYIKDLRSNCGFQGNAISFEPLNAAFSELEENASKDPKWKAYKYALGSSDGTLSINVAGNSQSSSLLEMRQEHENAAPDSKYISVETISVKRLDTVFDSICSNARNIYMKLDTQGYESFVLDGAEMSMKKIDTVQLELSAVALYEGQKLMPEMMEMMTELGYGLVAFEPGFYSPDGFVLQMDGIFHRRGK